MLMNEPISPLMRQLYRLRLVGFALLGMSGTLLALAYVLSLLIPPFDSIYRVIGPVLAVLLVGALPSLLLPRGPRVPAQHPTPPDPPLPGPAARAGRTLALLRAYTTQALAIVNPFQLLQVLAQNGGQFIAVLRRMPPVQLQDVTLHTRYRLPFDGQWYVFNGGVTPATSHSWDVVTQRYAYDFVVVDEQMQRHREQGTRPEEYFCYGLPILAAADGTVVAVRDGIRDAPRVGSFFFDWLCRDFRGNWVLIRHADREYSFSAHLIPGSITVKVGDEVRQGQPIGRCGNAGHSTEPHLHWHLQDHPNFWLAVGLPVPFAQVQTEEHTDPTTCVLSRGMRVQPAPDSGD